MWKLNLWGLHCTTRAIVGTWLHNPALNLGKEICLETRSPELCSHVSGTCAEHAEHGFGPAKIWEWCIFQNTINNSKQCQHQVLQTKSSANWFYFVLVWNYLSLTKKIKKVWKWAFIDQASAEPHTGTQTLEWWQMFSFLYRKMNVEYFFSPSAISLGKSYFIFLVNKLFFVFHDPETAKTISTACTNASWM